MAPSPRRAPVVVGRDLCSFSWIDQRDQKDKAARRREAELEGLRIALSPQPGLYIVLWGASAAVWTWDEGVVRQELQRAERDELLEAPRAPETLMLAADAGPGGLRLIPCLNGFEGQVWRGGELVGSRWWRERPNDRDWGLFSVSAGVEADAAPRPAPVGVLPRPFRPNEFRPQNANVLDKRIVFWGGAALAAAAISGVAYVGGVEMTYTRLSAHVATLEKDVAPVRAAHERVMSAAAAHRRIVDPIKGVDALGLVSAAADVVRAAGAKAKSVELRNDRMIILIPRENVGAVEGILRLLEDSPAFTGARLSETGTSVDDIQIEASLEGGKA